METSARRRAVGAARAVPERSAATDGPAAPRPTLDAYIAHRLGRGGAVQLRNFLVRPFGAPTFAGFWRFWNPVYGYVLLFFVYRPLRRWLPHPIASWLTFLVCGFCLHDLVGWLLAGRVRAPEMTLMFGAFGLQAVVGERLGLSTAGWPFVARAALNLGHLVLGWAVVAHLAVPLLMALGAGPAGAAG
jgi:hypothetical protein